MTLKEKIQADLIEAMKSKNEIATSAIRMLKAAVLKFETSGEKKTATDEDVVQIAGKEIKQRRDSIDQFEKGGRSELAAREKEEITILEKYLPAQLSEDELRTIIQDVIATTGASGKSDLGRVMGALMPRVKGKSDGGLVNKIVQELLK